MSSAEPPSFTEPSTHKLPTETQVKILNHQKPVKKLNLDKPSSQSLSFCSKQENIVLYQYLIGGSRTEGLPTVLRPTSCKKKSRIEISPGWFTPWSELYRWGCYLINIGSSPQMDQRLGKPYFFSGKSVLEKDPNHQSWQMSQPSVQVLTQKVEI